MLDLDFVSILRCPKTKSALVEVEKAELDMINEQRSQGDLDVLESALKCESDSSDYEKWIYPIVNGIPVLLVDEAFKVS